jgi:hypothetical protein
LRYFTYSHFNLLALFVLVFLGAVFVLLLFNLFVLIAPGFDLLDNPDLKLIDCLRLVLVFFNEALLPTFNGLLQLAGDAITLPFRAPLVQRYLRTFLLPLLAHICVASKSERNNIYLLPPFAALFIDATLLLAGLILLVLLVFFANLEPNLALVIFKRVRFLMSGAAKHC